MARVPPPRKHPNAERRSRAYRPPAEIERLQEAARRLGRHGHRDATMIRLTYRHGLRVSGQKSAPGATSPACPRTRRLGS